MQFGPPPQHLESRDSTRARTRSATTPSQVSKHISTKARDEESKSRADKEAKMQFSTRPAATQFLIPVLRLRNQKKLSKVAIKRALAPHSSRRSFFKARRHPSQLRDGGLAHPTQFPASKRKNGTADIASKECIKVMRTCRFAKREPRKVKVETRSEKKVIQNQYSHGKERIEKSADRGRQAILMPQPHPIPHQVRITTPCRLVVLESYTLSSSLEHSLESSLYPHLAPPQSSFTRSPLRVMPYRSHVQQLLPLDTLLGDEEFVLRDVSDGTSEPRSLSESKYEDPLERDEML